MRLKCDHCLRAGYPTFMVGGREYCGDCGCDRLAARLAEVERERDALRKAGCEVVSMLVRSRSEPSAVLADAIVIDATNLLAAALAPPGVGPPRDGATFGYLQRADPPAEGGGE